MMGKSIRAVLLAGFLPMAGETLPASADTTSDLKAQCAKETTFWEYYGVTRAEHSDGKKNWQYINACSDCKSKDDARISRGNESMKNLLLRKAFVLNGDLNAPPTSGNPCLPLVAAPTGR